jgi:hypothetical protein
MNKLIRIAAVLVFLIVIVALGMQGTAWASKLGVNNPAPAANVPNQGLPLVSRPAGTVTTGNTNVPLIVGQNVAVGSCAMVLLETAAPNVQYTASAVDEGAFSVAYPGNGFPSGLGSCLIKIDGLPVPSDKKLDATMQVCFPIPPTKNGLAYYWDGTKWVKTVLAPKDLQSCIDVPTSAPDPLYIAMFNQ